MKKLCSNFLKRFKTETELPETLATVVEPALVGAVVVEQGKRSGCKHYHHVDSG